MKEINLNFALKNLDEKDIEDSNAGKILASALANDNGNNPVKVWSWSQELYKGEALKLDPSDLEMFKKMITETVYLPAMTKAQILEVINK